MRKASTNHRKTRAALTARGETLALKGHDFSRAIAPGFSAALAAEGWFSGRFDFYHGQLTGRAEANSAR